jgi:hypothetical protein
VPWGALQGLDAGLTTVVNWAHNMLSADHADANIRALGEAGIRAVLYYLLATTRDRLRQPSGRGGAEVGGQPSSHHVVAHQFADPRGDRGLDGRRLPQSGEQVAAARRRAGDGQ